MFPEPGGMGRQPCTGHHCPRRDSKDPKIGITVTGPTLSHVFTFPRFLFLPSLACSTEGTPEIILLDTPFLTVLERTADPGLNRR